jgi:hypothetical protein
MTAEVEDVDDEDESPTEDEIEECLAAYQRVVTAAEADLEDLDLDAELDRVSDRSARRLRHGGQAGLLELRSERERVLALRPCSTRRPKQCSAIERSANALAANGRSSLFRRSMVARFVRAA